MRASLAPLLVLSLVVAGCLGGSGDDDEDDGADPAPAFLAVATVIDARGGHGEPSLGVAPDGVLFANGDAHTESGFDPGAVYRSSDGGHTWAQVGTPTAPYPNLDPDLAVDRDGNVWFDTLSLGCATVAVSRDGGDSWSDPNPAACTGPGGDRQYVVPTQGGEAYIYYHQLPTFYQTAAKTTDYGATWTPTGPVESPDHHLILSEGSGWGGGGFWNAHTGSVYFTFSWFRDSPLGQGDWFPGYAVTRDGGQTWETRFGPATHGAAIGLSLVVGAADEAGNVYLGWAERFGDANETHIYVSASTDDGKNWGKKVRVGDTVHSKVFPTLTAGAAGELAVAFYEADQAGHPDAVAADARWNVTLAWTRDALAATPVFEEATLSNGTVKVGRICASGTGCEGDREFLDYFQIKRLPDGRIGGVYNSLLEVEDENVIVYAATAAPLLSPWTGTAG